MLPQGVLPGREQFPGLGHSNASKYEDEMVSNPRHQGKTNENSQPTCPMYGKKHEGRCLTVETVVMDVVRALT